MTLGATNPITTPQPACAVFLDRDGTLVEDRGYVHRIEDFRLLPGVVEGLRALHNAGFLLIVITNQAGVAHGHFSLEQMHAFNTHLIHELAKRGVILTAILFCEHHPQAKLEIYRKDCSDRKPGAGLLLRAAQTWTLDLRRCYMVGDRGRDVQAGTAAGCTSVILPSHETTPQELRDALVARTWADVVRIIREHHVNACAACSAATSNC